LTTLPAGPAIQINCMLSPSRQQNERRFKPSPDKESRQFTNKKGSMIHNSRS